MLSSLEYATYGVYSPRGTSKSAENSRIVKGRLKNGSPVISNKMCNRIITEFSEIEDYIGDNSVLVPVPRSSPLKSEDLHPTLVICKSMAHHNLGNQTIPLIKRIKAVPKSSHQDGADSRPSVEIHRESLEVSKELISADTIILVDDVMTLGRTFMACAQVLNDYFPSITIKAFAVLRTRSREDNDILVEPMIGTMEYNPFSGKVRLPD